MRSSLDRSFDKLLNDAEFLLSLGIDPGNPDEWPEPAHGPRRTLFLLAIAAIALIVCSFLFLSFHQALHPPLSGIRIGS
jgi:hypothetical protein